MEKELRGREKRGTRKGKERGGGRGRGWQLVCVDTRNLEKWWRGRGRERGTRKELEGEGGRERGTRKEQLNKEEGCSLKGKAVKREVERKGGTIWKKS